MSIATCLMYIKITTKNKIRALITINHKCISNDYL